MTRLNHGRTEEIVERLGAGEFDQFERLYQRISPALMTWARFQLVGPLGKVLEPADLMQEVWLRGLEKFPSYDLQKGKFRPWIFGIAKFILLEAHRILREPAASAMIQDRNMTWVVDRTEEATCILDRLQRSETHLNLVAALEELDPKSRRIACLCGLEGLSYREAAELLDMNREAVAKAWQRLRARFAQEHPQWDYWSE